MSGDLVLDLGQMKREIKSRIEGLSLLDGGEFPGAADLIEVTFYVPRSLAAFVPMGAEITVTIPESVTR